MTFDLGFGRSWLQVPPQRETLGKKKKRTSTTLVTHKNMCRHEYTYLDNLYFKMYLKPTFLTFLPNYPFLGGGWEIFLSFECLSVPLKLQSCTEESHRRPTVWFILIMERMQNGKDVFITHDHCWVPIFLLLWPTGTSGSHSVFRPHVTVVRADLTRPQSSLCLIECKILGKRKLRNSHSWNPFVVSRFASIQAGWSSITFQVDLDFSRSS